MEQTKQKIYPNIEEFTTKHGNLLVDLVVRGTRQKPIIEVYIDNSEGVSAEDCADVSRDIAGYFDETEVVNTDYKLMVSSPGIDRPLKYIEQFAKHLNRKFEVEYDDDGEPRKLKGKLKGIDENMLTFESGKNMVVLKFEQISTAKVIISF